MYKGKTLKGEKDERKEKKMKLNGINSDKKFLLPIILLVVKKNL